MQVCERADDGPVSTRGMQNISTGHGLQVICTCVICVNYRVHSFLSLIGWLSGSQRSQRLACTTGWEGAGLCSLSAVTGPTLVGCIFTGLKFWNT